MSEQQAIALNRSPRTLLSSVSFHNAGHCVQSEFVTGTGRLRTRKFQAVVVRIEHPEHGTALIDTGYSPHYFRATSGFPERIVGMLIPVARMPAQTPAERWLDRGIDVDEIDRVFISHFHADHIGATADFSTQEFVIRREAYDSLVSMSRFQQVHNGFFRKLLLDNFEERTSSIDEASLQEDVTSDFPFACCDFWNDGSLILIDLPGHALGQTGYLLRTDDKSILYVVDACWDVEMMLQDAQLPWLAKKVQYDRVAYVETQSMLRETATRFDWEIVACHCPLTQFRDDHFESA